MSGYFESLLFDTQNPDYRCKLRPTDAQEVRALAADAAAMLVTHMRVVNRTLSDAFEDPRVEPSRKTLSELAWTMDELGGLVEAMHSIEDHAARNVLQKGQTDADGEQTAESSP